jgi:stromal membrane-associated protein
MEGPPPSDPSVLDGAGGGGVSADTPAPPPTLPPSAVNAAKPAPAQAAPPVQSSATASLTYAQQQARQLLSPAMSGRPSVGQVTPMPGTGVTASSPAAPPVQSANELFTLDFHSAPTGSTNTTAESFPRKDVKQDILSLFSSPPVTAPPSSAFGAYATAASVSVSTPALAQPGMGWDSLGAVPNQPPPQQSMLGSSGTGMWGASSGWAQPVAAAPASNNIWSSPSGSTTTAQQLGQFNSNDVWGGSGAASASAPAVSLLDIHSMLSLLIA